jgi:Tol biopolymer transport system component
MRWEPDGRSLVYLARSAEGAKMLRIGIGSGVVDTLPVTPGAHMSFSPDHRLIMDVRDHKVLWVSPVSGDSAYKVFSFPETDVRIDYPVWSPDGHWVLFDKATPSGGDIWILDGME